MPVSALDGGDRQYPGGRVLAANVLGESKVQSTLGLVGKSQHGGCGVGLDEGAQGLCTGVEGGEGPTLVPGFLRQPVHAQRHLGDDAQCAFGAQEELAQIRPGCRRGGPAEVEVATRSRDPHSIHHGVEASIATGGLPGRAGGGEPADACESETLREVSERKPLSTKELFSFGAGGAR
ncbi:Uncharacterised protein [Mycobacteroides abscessus subsp. abscessus]|nr:Uncharacterised protein [Mycobacteroides abscessus subsp. abscessus]